MTGEQVWGGGNDGAIRNRTKTVEHRRRNREYMRRWRADPRNCERERLKCLRSELERRVHSRYAGRRLFVTSHGRARCGFCWRGLPIKMVERLRISETAANEYVRVQIPCCADCG